MSNIAKTSAAIKKKLSLGDYSKPTRQQDSKKIKQHTSKPVRQRAGKQENKRSANQAKQQVVKPVQLQASLQASRQTVMPVSQPEKSPKTKATYYLGKLELEMLTQLYIKQLQQYNKADRSAIVCEAIRLIHERDK